MSGTVVPGPGVPTPRPRPTASWGDDTGLSPESSSDWYCRERFGVESWEVAGTDPDHPAEQ